MSKAKAEKLVTRVIVGPKGINIKDPQTGERRLAKVGETIKLPARSAKAFARYLEAPGVAKAKEAAAKAEADALADEGDNAEEEEQEEESSESEDDSNES